MGHRGDPIGIEQPLSLEAITEGKHLVEGPAVHRKEGDDEIADQALFRGFGTFLHGCRASPYRTSWEPGDELESTLSIPARSAGEEGLRRRTPDDAHAI